MSNHYFKFKQFVIGQEHTAMKVSTDACLFGAIVADQVKEKASTNFNILDIGAGTGLLAMMLQQVAVKAWVHAVEIDEDAYQDLEVNLNTSIWDHKPTPYHTSIQNFNSELLYDLIICNPPFFNNQLRSDTHARKIARHTDQLSWRALAESVDQYLSQDGDWWLLLPLREWNEFVFIIQEDWDVKDCIYIQSFKQSKPHRVVVRLHRKQDDKSHLVNLSFVFIYKEKGKYSENFTRLLTDYYLYL